MKCAGTSDHYFTAGSNWKSNNLVAGICDWNYELDRHCEDCADRSDSAKEQRICAGGTQYGREFLLYINPPFDTEFYLINHVYGSYECPRSDRGRIDLEFHGDWSAVGGGILGQYVVVSGSGAAKWSMVDHPDTGCISRGDADVCDKSW